MEAIMGKEYFNILGASADAGLNEIMDDRNHA
jgi:hypothetical protein